MTTFHIPDMSCGHCKATVEKTIHALDPAARIEFDMAARRIALDSRAESAKVRVALTEAGYPATPV
jgi:copper chaperone